MPGNFFHDLGVLLLTMCATLSLLLVGLFILAFILDLLGKGWVRRIKEDVENDTLDEWKNRESWIIKAEGRKNLDKQIQDFSAPISLNYQQITHIKIKIHLTIEFNLVKFSNERNKLIPLNQTR